jgi:hypothetical protein
MVNPVTSRAFEALPAKDDWTGIALGAIGGPLLVGMYMPGHQSDVFELLRTPLRHCCSDNHGKPLLHYFSTYDCSLTCADLAGYDAVDFAMPLTMQCGERWQPMIHQPFDVHGFAAQVTFNGQTG